MEDDIYTYLKMDHKKVAKLFKLFEDAPSERNQIEILEMIKKELLLHSESEQLTFYKALENYKATRDDILHAEKEHEEIINKLNAITINKTMTIGTKNKIMALKKIVEHHVSEEEDKIFSEARKVLSDKEAYLLKFKIHLIKEKLLNGEIVAEKTNVT